MSIFLRAFIRNRKELGAVAPSSKYLVAKMLKGLALESSHIVIELGAGTGVVTKKILERLNPEAVLFVFEINPQFYKFLKKEISDPRVVLINDSAEYISHYLTGTEYSKVDYIISSLPLSSIPAYLTNQIVTTIYESLSPEGVYIQFQYSFHRLQQLKRKFKKVSTDFESLNLPPAFVFSCHK